MRLGFSFRQRLSGSYWRMASPTEEGAICISFEAETPDVREFAIRKTWRIVGRIEAEGLAQGRELEGTLGYTILDARRVLCRVTFRGDDARQYELSGVQEWIRIAPVESLTILPASIYDDRGEEFARATLRFDWRTDWATWMKSFRLRWRP